MLVPPAEGWRPRLREILDPGSATGYILRVALVTSDECYKFRVNDCTKRYNHLFLSLWKKFGVTLKTKNFKIRSDA